MEDGLDRRGRKKLLKTGDESRTEVKCALEVD
jgi:hypothetical protein